MANKTWLRRRYWIRIEPNLGFGGVTVTEYTGLFVRRLLLECSRYAALALNKSGGPKPLSVSPLYRVNGRRLEALYPRVRGDGSGVYPVVHEGDTLFFEVGSEPGYLRVHEELAECLKGGVILTIGDLYVRVSLVRDEDVIAYREGGEPPIRLQPGSKIRLVIASPAQLVTVARPGSPWRILIPAPFYLFSLNALELHGGSVSGALASLLRVDETLSPAQSVLSTTNVVRFILRKGRVEPGLIGYVNVYVLDAPRESIEEAERVLAHALVMGVGVSRGIGLGVLWARVAR